jgi:SSS family solute:Na+ symporter
MLNSASTIFTMDVYNKVKNKTSQFELVTVGRICTVVFVLIALLIAPKLGSPKFGGIFTFIQEFQGFISPGILAIFIFGVLIHKAPRSVGMVGLFLNPCLYAICKWGGPLTGISALEWVSNRSFLDRMSICFAIVLIVLTIITIVNPLKEPIKLPVRESMDMKSSASTIFFGIAVVMATLVLYVIFW